ncbi:MAG: hypothetical protein IPK83_01055 [Planctomycetes bacterium]|nr:hypothetical protein [Planctomycetota bacterium]
MLPQTLKTRGIHAGVRFAPAATLDKAQKHAFQHKANEGFDWQRQEFSQSAWRLMSPQSDGDRRSLLKFSIQREGFNFEDSFPTSPLSVFYDNLRLATAVVEDVFGPKVMVGAGVVVRVTVQSDPDDARMFLGGKCLKLDDRLAPLGRPVHGVGLSMFLPPLPRRGAAELAGGGQDRNADRRRAPVVHRGRRPLGRAGTVERPDADRSRADGPQFHDEPGDLVYLKAGAVLIACRRKVSLQ